jgi:hypothetical protein
MNGSTESTPRRDCPWCSAKVAVDATHCPACGAELAQRDAIGDLVIPGVTAVDPALALYAAQPLRLPGPSPSQSMTGRAIVAAALLAADYAGVGGSGDGSSVDPASVGRPSDAALLAVERLEREESIPSPDAPPLDESPGHRDRAPG